MAECQLNCSGTGPLLVATTNRTMNWNQLLVEEYVIEHKTSVSANKK